MKLLVILGDGMADYPVPDLGGKTPLQAAYKPYMDYMAQYGISGIVKTIPEGITQPGSDIANLSVLGYDPRKHYTGRSPIEAVSMGIALGPEDTAFRCNLVTLSEEEPYDRKTMLDYCSGEISTHEAREIIKTMNEVLGDNEVTFYAGVSYRHCMVWKGAPGGFVLTPPHDISNKPVYGHLPTGPGGERLIRIMRRSAELLTVHPVNKARISDGTKPATSVWFWGEGKKPSIPSFYEKYALKGSVVSGVDLIKGLGLCAGMTSVDVDGATGNIDTNFEGKAYAAIREFERGQDFVFLHVEAPDECGHRNETMNKVKAVESIDSRVLGPILKELDARLEQPGFEDYAVMVLPDHATPLSLRTHTADPVPFTILIKSSLTYSGIDCYSEASAQTTGLHIDEGFKLMDYFLGLSGLKTS